jgi:acyl carrier protein
MTREDIYQRLHILFPEVLGGKPVALADATTAQDVEGWDSLNHVNLIFAIERAFGISLTTREAKKLRNVGDLVTLIGQKAG